MKCLRQQRPEGSCNRLGCARSSGSPSQCPWWQGLVCGSDGRPTPCAPLNSGASFPRPTTLPLGAFLTMEPFTSFPSSCLHATSIGPLPRSDLLTPRFSTQPLPALIDSCLRLGCPGLIPEEALAWVTLRTLKPAWEEEALV